MSDADKVCKWITDKVEEGRGAVVFSLEENAGYVGVFWAGEDERPALGIGENAIEAVLDAISKEAAEHRVQADGRNAPPSPVDFDDYGATQSAHR